MDSPLKRLEIFSKNLLLDLFLLAVRAKPNLPLPNLTVSDTVIFLRLNRIGDALVSTPVIKLIKEKTGCRTVVVADRANAFVFERCPCVDQVIVFQKGKGMWHILRQINALKAKVWVDLHDSLSTTGSLLAGLAKIPNKISLEKRNKTIFTHTVPDPDPAIFHVSERLASLLPILQIPFSNAELEVAYETKKESLSKVKYFLENLFPNPENIIGINISAGGENRFWGVENFRCLVQKLQDNKRKYIILCDKANFDRAKEMIEEKFIFCSPIFDEFAAIISQLSLLFTPDTSAVHLASAFHVPVFGLYVSEKAGFLNWYPYQSPYDWIISPPPLSQISFEETYEKLSVFMEKMNLDV